MRISLNDPSFPQSLADTAQIYNIALRERPQSSGYTIPVSEEAINELIEDATDSFLIVERQNAKLLGSALVAQYKNIGWVLQLLAVDPEQQQKGFGSKILESVRREVFFSDPKASLTLYVDEEDRLAHKFYKKHKGRIDLRKRLVDDSNNVLVCVSFPPLAPKVNMDNRKDRPADPSLSESSLAGAGPAPSSCGVLH